MLLLVRSASAQPKQKLTCASCHQTEAMSQPLSQMGHALTLPGSNPVLGDHSRYTFQKGAYSYTVETTNGKTIYTVTDGTQTITVPVVWSLGAQAQTWVLERNGQLFESLVSYYPLIKGLGITTGDERIAPTTIEEAFGRPMSGAEAKVCFGCHSTHAIVDQKLDLAALQPGVTCQHCHTEADAHLASMISGSGHILFPKRLGQMSTEDLSNFCGQCHRSWETVVRGHWHGQADVRFQPYRLANSRCYNGTDPRISCVACHNPHEAVVRVASTYDSKCLACHAPAAVAAAATKGQVQPKVCPIAKSNCTTCHMPKVSLPNGLLLLTDHQIRIVKPGEAYPN
jgi:hypothetical protein